jgi:hypothetical protein
VAVPGREGTYADAVTENLWRPPSAESPTGSAGGFGVASPPDRADALRTALLVVLGGMLGGVVMGVVWAALAPEIWLDIREDGAYPEAAAQDRWFGADGWFLVLGVVLGVGLAGVAWWRGRRHPLGALLGVTVGGLLGALMAWWLGGFLGPADPADLLPSAAVGTRVQLGLGLRAMAVLLAPAVAGVAAFVALAAAAPPREVGERLVP